MKVHDDHKVELSCLIRALMNSSQHSGAEIIIRHVSPHKIAASVRGVAPKIGEDTTICLSDTQVAKGRVISVRENYFVAELESELEVEALADLAKHTQEFLRDEGGFDLCTTGRILPRKIDPAKSHLV